MPDYVSNLDSDMNNVPTAADVFALDIPVPPRRTPIDAAALKDALVRKPDGTMAFRGFLLTPTGLLSDAGAVDYDDWLDLGYTLRQLEGSLSWLIGDWLVFGEREYGKTYQQLAEMLGVEVATLYDWRYVASAVHFSVRTEKLHWSHHKLVAGLDEAQQVAWLDWAANNGRSVGEMRRMLAAARAEDNQSISQQPPALLTKAQADSLKSVIKWASFAPERVKRLDPAALLSQVDQAMEVLATVRRRIAGDHE